MINVFFNLPHLVKRAFPMNNKLMGYRFQGLCNKHVSKKNVILKEILFKKMIQAQVCTIIRHYNPHHNSINYFS